MLSLVLLLAAPTGGALTAAPVGVTRTLVDVPGADEPHTPAALNRALAFRYYISQTPPPSAVLILIPGLNSGPNTFDILARRLVAAHGPGLEVWAVAPRSGLLIDRRGIETALAYQNPDFALGYYYGSLPIDGQTFHLLKGTEVPYMAYWGVDIHLRDIRALVQEARHRYPDARVVLGGHSLGGVLAALYTGYDFARTPGTTPPGAPHPVETGAQDLSGLLLIDGIPVRLPFRITPDDYLHGFGIPFFERIPGLDSLTANDPRERVDPFLSASRLSRTQDSLLLDVITVYAYLRPEDASYFPFYPRRGLRITNEALVAALFSDQMQHDLLVRVAVEVPHGVFGRVPDPANIDPGGLLDLQSGEPAPGERLIRVLHGQAQTGVRVPIRELVAAIARSGGNFTQWYFPWRIVLDLILAGNLDTSDAFSSRYMSLTHVRDTRVPILILGAGHGLIRYPGITEFYQSRIATPSNRVVVKIFPDYSHLDIEDADPNPAVPLILTWLESVVH